MRGNRGTRESHAKLYRLCVLADNSALTKASAMREDDGGASASATTARSAQEAPLN